jgi:hypothetical protein
MIITLKINIKLKIIKKIWVNKTNKSNNNNNNYNNNNYNNLIMKTKKLL